MKKKIILLIFLTLLLAAVTAVGFYWDPFIDWLPIDQSGWNVTENRGRCYLDEDGDPLTGCAGAFPTQQIDQTGYVLEK